MVALAQTYVFYDGKQQSATMKMYLDSTAAAVANEGNEIAIDLLALSNTSPQASASTVRGHGPFTSPPCPVSQGTIATYLDVADKAVFVFQDAQGGLHKYQVPCPKSSIFQADAETIDFTVAAVKAFVADMTFTTFGGTAPGTTKAILTRQGTPLAASVGGYRRRSKASRKFNIYTRNAVLTGGGGAP